jgi:hypothetical protein
MGTPQLAQYADFDADQTGGTAMSSLDVLVRRDTPC